MNPTSSPPVLTPTSPLPIPSTANNNVAPIIRTSNPTKIKTNNKNITATTTTTTTTTTPSTTPITAPPPSITNTSRTFQLLSSGPLCDKTYAVAHFLIENPNLDIANWHTPIHIARSGVDKTRKYPPYEASAPPEARQKMRKEIQKIRRTYPFHIEDGSKKNVFNGQLEMDQSNKFEAEGVTPGSKHKSGFNGHLDEQKLKQIEHHANKYVIFKAESGGEIFRVIPCDDWYSFKREQTNIPLSLEDAEKILKERIKPEKSNATTATPEKPVEVKFDIREKMNQIKKEKPIKHEFDLTGDEAVEDDDGGLGPKKQKKETAEDMDYEVDFDTDNREDKQKVKNTFVSKLSTDAKETKQLMRENRHDGFDDELSDDDQEFPGVDELKAKDAKTNEKRPAESQANPGGTAKKARTEPGPNNSPSTPVVSEKEFEKQLREFMGRHPKVQLSKLITNFRQTISQMGKPTFTTIIKRIADAKKEDGFTYVYLKEFR